MPLASQHFCYNAPSAYPGQSLQLPAQVEGSKRRGFPRLGFPVATMPESTFLGTYIPFAKADLVTRNVWKKFGPRSM